MRKSLLLLLFLLTVSPLYCQNDTAYLVFPRTSLEQIVLDLHKLDYLQEAHQIDSIKIAIFAKQLSYKDSIIHKQELQLDLSDSIQSKYVAQQQLFIEEQKKLEQQVVVVKAQRNIISLSGVVAIILLLL